MKPDVREKVCEKIREALTGSERSWKLFCDTDGDRRPSPMTLVGYSLCEQAIVPLTTNKGDMDRTATMLGVLNEIRKRGEIRTKVLMIVWNNVKSLKDEPMVSHGVQIP